MPRLAPTLAATLTTCALTTATLAIGPEHRDRAIDMIDRATAYLLTQQHPTGGWAVPEDPASPTFPAITGLVLNALALHPNPDSPGADQRARAADRAVAYILSHAQPDGGIYAALLPSYNTSICVSALSRCRDRDPRVTPAINDAVAFLKSLQWSEAAGPTNPDGSPSPASDTVQAVTRDHPFYGGIGYGRHGRPDNSNLNLAMQAFHDAGLDRDDPVFQRALVFLQRTQMHHAVNDAPYAAGSTQGGFIYATAETGNAPGQGQSMAGMIEESLDDGSRVSRLRAYGSMTYAAFKTMIYAGLSQDDPRVRLAMGWISRHYTVAENPALGLDGYYYYILTFARALDAAGIDTLTVTLAPPTRPASPSLDQQAAPPSILRPVGPVRHHPDTGVVEFDCDWAADLIDHLATLQNPDGSFRSIDPRWMENNAVLITAYATLALEHALGPDRPD